MKNISNTPKEVALSNILRLSKLDGVNTELRIMELSDLIEDIKESLGSMIDIGLSLNDILSVVSERLRIHESPDQEKVKDTSSDAIISSYRDLRDNLDKAAISKILASGLEMLGYSDSEFLMGEDMPEIFTYVKNVFADEAFDVLSEEFSDPRVKYSKDFSECIRLLLTGEVSYCLLPFEERGGIRLPIVEQLIFKNDLKVSSVTPVFGPDGTQDLKYALVSDRFATADFSPYDDRYLEIRVPESSGVSLSEIISSAKLFGHSVYRVNTLSVHEDTDSSQLFSIVFRADGENFSSLFTYLALFVNGYVIIGTYKNLE